MTRNPVRAAALVVAITFGSGMLGVRSARAGETGATAGGASGLPAAPPPPLDPLAPGYAPQAPAAATTGGDRAPASVPVTRRWWFWAGVGVLVAGTVTVLVIAGKPSQPPTSDLGNMEAFRR